MTVKRKKLFFIATFIIIAAVAIVLCVGLFTQRQKSEFDGTLIEINIEFVDII